MSDGKRLGERFRAAMEADALQRADAARRAEVVAAESRAAVLGLIAEVEALAKEVGVGVLKRDGEALVWTVDGKTLRLSQRGVSDTLLAEWSESGRSAPEAVAAVVGREPQLGMRWVLTLGEGARAEKLVWWDAGLTRALVKGLGLPDPG